MPALLRALKGVELRDLPWRPPSLLLRMKLRKDTVKLRKGKPYLDPYKILVSEIMLQQTQVERVIPFYAEFTRRFPTPAVLARAPFPKVLKAWSGLGYNRRAKYLHAAAKVIVKEGFTGQKLPGVGPYTKAAVEAFAHNKPTVFIETNIRTVFLYHCFQSNVLQNVRISDKEILPLIKRALKKSGLPPREFYWRLMDYGAVLKKRGVRLNNKSVHYTKQSKFEGSYRQLRGQVLRALLASPSTVFKLQKITGRKKSEVARVLANLSTEGLVTIKNRRITIAK